ncbi:hypothetical protein BACCAP_04211, partial [Pseudoflavonifractor capillosus ATCC 29799]
VFRLSQSLGEFHQFDLNVANMDNFFAPVFTMGKYIRKATRC